MAAKLRTQIQLTARDTRLLQWVGEQFVVNVRELERLVVMDAQHQGLVPAGKYLGRDTLRRWKQAGWVETLHVLKRGSHVFLTALGTRLTGLPYAPRTPGKADLAHLTHQDGVNKVRLYVEKTAWEQKQACRWVSERTLLQQQLLARQSQPHQLLPHRPDGIVYWEAMCIAIEVERSHKRVDRLRHILEGYLYSTNYHQAYFFCDTPALEQAVQHHWAAVVATLPVHEQSTLQNKVVVMALPWYANA
jgi:hypothetical protein